MAAFPAGLIFLKPRIASWRYQRGSRSLAANLISKTPVNLQLPVDSKAMEDEDDDDFDVPEEIEEVLEEILRALRDKNREVQWVKNLFFNWKDLPVIIILILSTFHQVSN